MIIEKPFYPHNGETIGILREKFPRKTRVFFINPNETSNWKTL